jgi:hypothetical protein
LLIHLIFRPALQALEKVTAELNRQFPNVPRVHKPAPVLGNDDFPTNYGLNVTDPQTYGEDSHSLMHA